MTLGVFTGFLKGMLGLLGKRRALWWRSNLVETLAPMIEVPVASGRTLRFYGHGTYVIWRTERILSKEPETFQWVESMQPGDVLWDVGANVGIYTLLAASRPGVRVVALEPVANSYFTLTKSISLNSFREQVQALCVAATDRMGVDTIYLTSSLSGSSGHAVGEPVNESQSAFTPVDSYTVLCASLDWLAEHLGLPFPTHIKIDVDGLEDKVVAGMVGILRDQRLKSVLVEVHDGSTALRLLQEAGFGLSGSGRLNMILNRESQGPA
jgi:FkbM family methyltransferase